MTHTLLDAPQNMVQEYPQPSTTDTRVNIEKHVAWMFQNVGFQHSGAATSTLDDVTLTIQAGQMTALLGPNGAGKSTLLQVMLGTLRPSRGHVAFRSMPLSQWNSGALARIVAVVPQYEAEPLFTVREIVGMGRYPHLGAWRREGAHDRAVIHAAMQRCGVEQFADRWLPTLSGGERQRVRIARALAQEPSVIVLDEPTAALDVRYEMETFELLRELRDDGVTVVLATHNINLAARYADDLVLLRQGQIVAYGAAEHVLRAERVGWVYEWPVLVASDSSGVPQIIPQSSLREAHV